jgi:predicted DNA-binding protein (UPF0251 family)
MIEELTVRVIKATLVSDMQMLAIKGIARYGNARRMVTLNEEAAYRLCHHDFFGLTQQEAAQVLGIDQTTVTRRLRSLKDKAPQLFPILSKNTAAIYNRFITGNMSVKEIACDLNLTPRHCWQVLQNLWDTRKETGLYFRSGSRQRLQYRSWMDEYVKESW